MAEVKLDFTGESAELRASLTETRDLLVEIRDAQQATNKAIQADATKNVQAAEKFNDTLEASVTLTQELGEAGLGSLTKDLGLAAKGAREFEKAATDGSDGVETAFKAIVDQARKANTEAKEIAKTEGVIVREIDKHKAAQIDLLVAMKAISKEEANVFKESIAITDSFEEQVKPVTSLRTQFRLAKEELDALVEASDGKITPELVAAAKRAGELQDRIGDLTDLTTAFNPDKKFQAFANVLGNVANGFQAATAAAGLLGSENEDLQKGLLKIQQTVAFVQGLQGFLGGLSDNLKNIKTLILATTVAQKANTAATVADSTAKQADAVATGAAATANLGFVGTIRAVTAALLASPLAPIIATIAVLGATIVAVTQDTRDYKKEVDDLNDALDELTRKELQNIDNRKRLELIQSERKAIQQGETEDAQIRQRERDHEIELNALLDKRLQLERELAIRSNQVLALVEDGSDAAREAAVEQDKAYASLKDTITQLDSDIDALNANRENEEAKDSNDRIARAKKEASERLGIAKKLNADLAALNKQLQDAIRSARLEDATPEQRAALERQAADERVDILANEIRRINQLRTGQAALTLAQEEQLDVLRIQNGERYWKAIQEIDRNNASIRRTLIADEAEKETQELEATLAERATILRAAGATEQQILDEAAAKREALRVTQAQREIDLQTRIAVASVEARERGGATEEEFERQKQEAILKIKIEAAEKSLALIAANTTLEGQAITAEFQALIAKLKNELAGLGTGATSKEFNIFKLLGFDLTAEQQAAVEQSIQQVVGLVNSAIAAQEAEVQNAISAADRIIAERQRITDNLQQQLANELELNAQGLANNVDGIRQQIAANDEAAAAEIARRNALLEDQKRIARQQLLIDSVVQASALLTAGAKVFSAEAPKGIIGIIAAIGTIASMVAAFVTLKARAKAIANEGNAQFGDGGWTDGPSHKRGGRNINVEGGEFMTNKKQAGKWGDVLEGINENDWTRSRQAKLVELVESANIQLSSDEADNFVEIKKDSHLTQKFETKRLERQVASLTEEVKALRGDNNTRTGQEGSFTVTRKPGRTVRKR